MSNPSARLVRMYTTQKEADDTMRAWMGYSFFKGIREIEQATGCRGAQDNWIKLDIAYIFTTIMYNRTRGPSTACNLLYRQGNPVTAYKAFRGEYYMTLKDMLKRRIGEYTAYCVLTSKFTQSTKN